jgi:branched-chain amino acid transport system ATP-binding protein
MLSTHDLQKRFGGVQATDGVSLSIHEQELRCIIGPNGAGKSTLFALLAGIHRPDHGRIVLKGDDVTRLPAFRRVRRGLGLTFQTNRALHALTVRENLDTAPTRRCRSEAWDLYTYALKAFDLSDDLDCIAAELPHHKLHWLEICMVLASGPDLLMLDEPTAGMSPEETRATAEVIRALNARGLTMIVVEHDMSFVREIAKTVTVLHQGRIFAEGEMDDITSRQDVRDIYLGRVRAET